MERQIIIDWYSRLLTLYTRQWANIILTSQSFIDFLSTKSPKHWFTTRLQGIHTD